MKRIYILTILLTLSATISAAPINFECKFTREASANGIKDSTFNMSYLLDEAAKKAYITGNVGSSEVQYITNATGGITFIEITETGNVMVTAISNKDHSAVHSRNGIIFGNLVPTQYYGTCIAR